MTWLLALGTVAAIFGMLPPEINKAPHTAHFALAQAAAVNAHTLLALLLLLLLLLP
jgi:hypothetical protein